MLEQIKDVKVFEVDDSKDNYYRDGTPKWLAEKLATYADNLQKEEWISEEAFFSNARKKVCELYSQK